MNTMTYRNKEFLIFAHGETCKDKEGQVIDLPSNVCVIMNCTNTKTKMTAYRMCKLIKHMIDNHKVNNHKMVSFNDNDNYNEYFKKFLMAQIASIVLSLIPESNKNKNEESPFCLYYKNCPNVYLNFIDRENNFQPGIFELPVFMQVTKKSNQSVFFGIKNTNQNNVSNFNNFFDSTNGEYYCDTLKETIKNKTNNKNFDSDTLDTLDSIFYKKNDNLFKVVKLVANQKPDNNSLISNQTLSGIDDNNNSSINEESLHQISDLNEFIEKIKKNSNFNNTFYIITAIVCRGGTKLETEKRYLLGDSKTKIAKICNNENNCVENEDLYNIINDMYNNWVNNPTKNTLRYGGSKKTHAKK